MSNNKWFNKLKQLDNYAFLSGWYNLPEKLVSDLDIIIKPEMLKELEEALYNQNEGQLINHFRHESTCDYFVLALRNKNKVQFFLIDSATDYRGNGWIWFTAEELLKARRPWKGFWLAASEVEFKYLLVKKILKGLVSESSAKRLSELVEELNGRAQILAVELLGRSLGRQITQWIQTNAWENVQNHMAVLKKALKRRKLRQDPLNTLRYWLSEIPRIWQRLWYPTGLFVAVLGPDGSGKSTLITQLERELKGAFRRTVSLHLMPRLFGKCSNVGPVIDPHSKPPRSLPTSFLKLIYYFINYNLGYWFIIRPALVRSTLLFFDRYYDDLMMDPRRYRYGGSMRLARWLRNFIPRPDVFLVLNVSKEKLLERKQEVTLDELQRQVTAYRQFALSTPNAYLIDGGPSLEEVTHEARDVLLNYLHARYSSRRHIWFPAELNKELEWLTQALGVEISKDCPTHSWLRLPDGRGYLLHLATTRIFRRGLELYAAQGKKARLGKAVLNSMARFGIKGPGLIRVHLHERKDSIFQTLREVFGQANLFFSVSLGTPGPHRKPVVQVLTGSGEVLGYVKVGWNEETSTLVKNEVEWLKRLNAEPLPFRAPTVLYANNSEVRNLCVQGPPPDGSRPAPRTWSPAYMDVLCALASRRVRRCPLEETNFWLRIVNRIKAVQNPYWKYRLKEAMEKVRWHWENKEVPLHPAHGDFAPWNARYAGEKLFLYDWEYAMEEAPAGYDLFHFLVRSLAWAEGFVLSKMARKVNQLARDTNAAYYWTHIGVSIQEIDKLSQLYFLNQAVQYCVDGLFHIGDEHANTFTFLSMVQ